MPTQVNIYEAKTQLSKLIEQVLDGERVIIARNGKPVVDLVPHRAGDGIRFGALQGQIRYDEADFVAADLDIAAMWNPDLGVEQPSAS